jgi:hypothetical protein
MPRGYKDHAEVVTRFWERVNKTDDCWLWTRATVSGYGCFRLAGRTVYAHRFSYEEAFGPLPEGACVLHRCDNRLCVRPDHFFLGNRGDNIRDCASKDRTPYGTQQHMAVLTDDLVREIRARYESGGISQNALAQEYNVSQMTISLVVRRKTWRRVA